MPRRIEVTGCLKVVGVTLLVSALLACSSVSSIPRAEQAPTGAEPASPGEVSAQQLVILHTGYVRGVLSPVSDCG